MSPERRKDTRHLHMGRFITILDHVVTLQDILRRDPGVAGKRVMEGLVIKALSQLEQLMKEDDGVYNHMLKFNKDHALDQETINELSQLEKDEPKLFSEEERNFLQKTKEKVETEKPRVNVISELLKRVYGKSAGGGT